MLHIPASFRSFQNWFSTQKLGLLPLFAEHFFESSYSGSDTVLPTYVKLWKHSWKAFYNTSVYALVTFVVTSSRLANCYSFRTLFSCRNRKKLNGDKSVNTVDVPIPCLTRSFFDHHQPMCRCVVREEKPTVSWLFSNISISLHPWSDAEFWHTFLCL